MREGGGDIQQRGPGQQAQTTGVAAVRTKPLYVGHPLYQLS